MKEWVSKLLGIHKPEDPCAQDQCTDASDERYHAGQRYVEASINRASVMSKRATDIPTGKRADLVTALLLARDDAARMREGERGGD
ncbi:MAG TPA: hypothetical protein VK689_21420 [Armatimonadota bacterium]|nr:hypothetical protein [Armatimonadota bacterium]